LLSEYEWGYQPSSTPGSSCKRAKTPGEMWNEGDSQQHHSLGLRHECSRTRKRCASRQALSFEKTAMFPMPMARIPSFNSGARSGVRDQVLPRHKNPLKATMGFSNVWSQAGVVNPKPVERMDEKAEYHANLENFETHLEEIHQQDLEDKIKSWMGIPKPGANGKAGKEKELAAARQEWELFEALIPLVEKLNVGYTAPFEDKLEHVTKAFQSMDTSGDETEGDDKISLQEFEECLRAVDITVASETVLQAFQKFDTNSNGYLDLSEIMLGIQKLEKHALSGAHDSRGVQALIPH